MSHSVWWVWAVGALMLGCFEMVLPGYVLLGFAIGAAAIGLLFLFGGPLAVWVGGSMPLTMLLFAGLSLLTWICLRWIFRSPDGQSKTFERDIND